MEEWKEVKLGDLLAVPIRNGLTKPSKIRGKGIKMIGMKEIFTYDIIRDCKMELVPVTEKEFSNCLIKKNDLLFARQSLTLEGAGKCAIVKETDNKTVFESHLIRLRIDEQLTVPSFIYYYFRSPFGKSQIQTLVQQVAAAGIRGKELIKLKIKIPSLPIQNKIASLLSSLDDKIELNRRINTNLEEQAQALFKSWFIDFEPFKDGKFVDSELGMIPEGWKVGSYLDIVSILGGGTPRTTIPQYWNGDIPFFTPKDTNNSCFCISTEKTLTEEGLNACSSRLYPMGTVFVTARGTVGKITMAGGPMAMNQSCYAIQANEEYSQYYIYLQTIHLIDRIKKKSNGAVFSAITARDFDEKIVIPVNKVVHQFNNVVQPLFTNILINLQESARLSALRDTLLPKLMSGEIEI